MANLLLTGLNDNALKDIKHLLEQKYGYVQDSQVLDNNLSQIVSRGNQKDNSNEKSLIEIPQNFLDAITIEGIKNFISQNNFRKENDVSHISDFYDNMKAGLLVVRFDEQLDDYFIIDYNRILNQIFKSGQDKLFNTRLDDFSQLNQSIKDAIKRVLQNQTPEHFENVYDQQFLSVNIYPFDRQIASTVIFDFSEREITRKETAAMAHRFKRLNLILDDKVNQLKSTKEQLELILEGSHDGTFDYHLDNDEMIVKPLFKHQLGYQEKEIRIKNFEEYINCVDQEYRQIVSQSFLNLKKGEGDDIDIVVKLIKKDGQRFWVRLRAVGKFNDQGYVTRIAGVHSDINQFKLNEELIKEQNIELQKAIQTKNMFISIIAHDLRNPFNAILGLSELLKRRITPENDKKSADMLAVLYQSAKNTFDMLNNLLLWSQSQQNILKFNPERCALSMVAQEAMEEVKGQAERKNITLLNNVDRAVLIDIDRQMIQTAIRNLIGNSIKFTNENGFVIVSSLQEGNKVSIIIEDNGVGMNQETIQKLLTEEKNRSTAGTLGEQGSGMGLMLVKEFIRRHNGKFNIESTLGKGSKFIIELTKNNE